MVATYRVARRAQYNGVWREDGLIPEAHDFYLIDNLVHTGFLDEVDVPEEEFRAAVAKLPEAQQEHILIKAGLHPDYTLEGARRTPHGHRTTQESQNTHARELVSLKSSAPAQVDATPAGPDEPKRAPAKKAAPKKAT